MSATCSGVMNGISVACMDGLSLSPALKGAVQVKKQGDLYRLARYIHDTNSFSLDKAGEIVARLSSLEKLLREAADELSGVTKLSKGDFTVFYCWQADLPNSTNRGFIKKALNNALSNLQKSAKLENTPVVESDTSNTPGSPDIIHTILQKIDSSSVFVADVSLINGKFPNSNVMFELGYALRSLEDKRVIMVFNTSFGDPKDLPFDLGFKRQLLYDVSENEQNKSDRRKQLASKLEGAVGEIIKKYLC